ncbi:uncharacterized protein B0H64DRAFT_91535 [Chaetomium fimeti]|uniref:Secreted protein n=1 Tax=Chaetomium fimeti TaxID=1854472 RepID=A0AAE0LVJ3_9PEZI|nr:hypothetical protein B0H64DRAFT_91535 [Chaetomium fimeti]
MGGDLVVLLFFFLPFFFELLAAPERPRHLLRVWVARKQATDAMMKQFVSLQVFLLRQSATSRLPGSKQEADLAEVGPCWSFASFRYVIGNTNQQHKGAEELVSLYSPATMLSILRHEWARHVGTWYTAGPESFLQQRTRVP